MNDPMACAIGLGVMKEIDRTNLVLKTEENGILFKSLLKEICGNQCLRPKHVPHSAKHVLNRVAEVP